MSARTDMIDDSAILSSSSSSNRLTDQLLRQALAPPPPLFATSQSNNRFAALQLPFIMHRQEHLNRNPQHHPQVIDILQAAIEIVDRPPQHPFGRPVAIVEPDDDEFDTPTPTSL
ncbi:hypothetical protein IV203_011687 [Nitzschia inconspicua]|uniref:Uncharacterized protein n=1 Tax=Nitzschia inconspicua TaxID=303405 RepID=A0A9K3PJ34_9STRA|nr:hypothetical protein IV203_011687 [Nitzschia inconspicua]